MSKNLKILSTISDWSAVNKSLLVKLSGIGNEGFKVDILVSTQQELSNEPIPNSVGYRKPDLCNSGLSRSLVVDRIS